MEQQTTQKMFNSTRIGGYERSVENEVEAVSVLRKKTGCYTRL